MPFTVAGTSRAGLAAGVAALALAACGERAPSDGWTMFRNLALARRLEVTVADGPAREAAERAGKRLRLMTGIEVELPHSSEASAVPSARVLIGDAETAGMGAALARLGVETSARGFTFLGREYERPGDALVATIEDPERPGFPLMLFFGSSPERIAPYVRDLTPAAKRGFRVYRSGALARQGQLADGGSPIEASLVELEDARELLFEDEVRVQGPGFELVAPKGFDEQAFAAYFATLRRAREELLALLAPEGEPPIIRLRAYLHPGDKLRFARDGALASLAPSGEVEVVLAQGLPDDAGFGLARALALATLGTPAEEWLLDAAGAYAVPRWWGRDKDEWIAHLVAGGLVPPIEVLLDPAARLSPHLAVPLRGALLRHIAKKLGRDGLRALWRGETTLALDERLRAGFGERLSRIHERYASRVMDARGARLSEVLNRTFLAGVNLRGPGLSERALTAGFGTRACRASLERARALGANAVALDFRAFSQLWPPEFAGDTPPAPLACDASDLALGATLFDARELGLATMLKPQLLASGSGTWMGWLVSDSPRAAEQFFADQQRLLVHCGLLGELCGAAIVCLATEVPLASVTRRTPDELPWIPAHLKDDLARWRATVNAVRGSFHGALTYAASLINEAGRIEFWPELDFVGLDLYGTLSSPPYSAARPDDDAVLARLTSELHEAIELGRREERRVLVTEIGFSRTAQAWRGPEEMRGPSDPEEQARLFDGLASALERLGRERDDLAGLFVWDWSTDPETGARASEARVFSPQNQPAERALARLFGSQ